MKPFHRAVGLSLALTLGLNACGQKAPTPGSDYKEAPAFDLPTLKGPKVSLASLKGQVVLLDFWATWCEPCVESIPVFESLHKKYDGKGLTVLGVNVDGGPDEVPAFVKKLGMTYPVLMDDDYSVMRAYKVRGIPNLFLLDDQGRIRKHWVGVDDQLEATVEAEIKALLAEAGKPVEAAQAAAAPAAKNLETVSFPYDLSDIALDVRKALDRNVEWLKKNAGAKVVVEGHSDLHGTQEYNLALGKRRAEAVAGYYRAKGVPASRLKVDSKGMSEPLCMDDGDACRQKNRRVVTRSL